jgi:hypothetical protein
MFCTAKTSLTDSDLTAQYGDNIKHGLLPSSPFGASDRSGDGLLLDATLKQLVGSLKSQNIVPAVTANASSGDSFVLKQKLFLASIKEEYCFYDSRYKYALQKLLSTVQQGYMTQSGDVQQGIQTYLQYTQRLNQKINDLTQIINAITIDMESGAANLSNEVKKFNKEVQEKQKALEEQNKILSSQSAATKLNKEMVKFTEKKNKYTNNLLNLYGFMNIVALGLLIYVYRSAGN